MRSFIAIEISPEIKTRIGAFCSDLKELGIRASFPSKSGLHLTLKFLGDIKTDQLPDLGRALQSSCQGLTSFSISMAGMGAFPHLASPRVVWLGVKPCAQLLELQLRIEQRSLDLGFQPEGRNFRPHVTVARVRSARRKERLIAFIRSHSQTEVGQSPVDSVHLFKSSSGARGPLYKKLLSVVI